jgi:PTS system galactitol-specific IIC component
MDAVFKAINDGVMWFVGLGATVGVPIVLFVLGMVFHVGWQKAIKGGVTMGIGLYGLFMVLDKIIGAMNPVITAIATRFHIAKAIIDVNWADSGLCWSWPGVPAVLLGTIAINAVLVLLRLQKTMWTDLWSFWHGESMGAIAWGLSGNVMIGVATGIIYLIVGAWLSDLTAKKYQEFNEMPIIGVPCGPTVQASIAAIPIVWVLDRLPGIKDWDISPEMMRKKLGLFGETGIQGLIIGLVFGIAAGYTLANTLILGMAVASIMVLLVRMVGIIAEGLIPLAQGIASYLREHIKGREIFVAVDCAVLLGHPSVIVSSIILFPIMIVLAALLPGVNMIPIPSLAVIPFMAGAVVPYTKGNLVKTVIVLAIFLIPYMYFSTLMAPEHTVAYAKIGLYAKEIGSGALLSSWDTGGDPLGFVITSVWKLLGFTAGLAK